MLTPSKSSVRLKKGHTYREFIIRLNAETTPICKLCNYLKLKPDEFRNTYDGVYNLPIEKIGTLKKPKLETIPTGTDWRATS